MNTGSDGRGRLSQAWQRYRELRSPAMDRLVRDRLPAGDEISQLLWANSDQVGHAAQAPRHNLEAMARGGFYGLLAPLELGGLGLGYDDVCEVAEELAGSCATTALVWVQHLRLLGAMLCTGSAPELVRRHQAEVVSGRAKGGVVLTGLMPGPARLVATQGGSGATPKWALDGEAPWFSGWGVVDLVVVVARKQSGGIANFLLTAGDLARAEVAELELSALKGTRTVQLRFAGMRVSAGQLLSEEPATSLVEDPVRLRLNGSFPLGVARRCCALVGPSSMDEQLARARECLRSAATSDEVAQARARAAELAVRAAHLLAVSTGSRAALAGDVAERLSREAALLLVFGSRPSIRSALVERLLGA